MGDSVNGVCKTCSALLDRSGECPECSVKDFRRGVRFFGFVALLILVGVTGATIAVISLIHHFFK